MISKGSILRYFLGIAIGFFIGVYFGLYILPNPKHEERIMFLENEIEYKDRMIEGLAKELQP